jgi:hypothetical protein
VTAVLAVSFVAALKAMDWLSPGGTGATAAPVLAQVPPLPQARRSSSIVVPVAITMASIRDLADRAAPRNFAGKADNPIPKILQNADIAWTASRGAITASGAQNTLALATPLNGSLNVKGSLSADLKGALGDNLSKLLGGDVAKQIGGINIKNLNAHADIRGSIAMTAHPALLPSWRVEPNLTAQVNLSDTTVAVAGAQFGVPAQVKPVIDRAVNDQLANLQQRISNDPALERAARREWAKICRSIPLQSASVPQGLWLELRPTRAVAAQPKIDASAVTLTLGIEADTRVTSAQTKPECPFPAALDIVTTDVGHLDIGMPIDLPFTELTKIVELQLVGKTFPENGGAAAITVKRAAVAASGDRLLISLLVNANAGGTGMFGFGGDATVHIWGKPALDPAQQTLRLKEIEPTIRRTRPASASTPKSPACGFPASPSTPRRCG